MTEDDWDSDTDTETNFFLLFFFGEEFRMISGSRKMKKMWKCRHCGHWIPKQLYLFHDSLRSEEDHGEKLLSHETGCNKNEIRQRRLDRNK